MDSCDACGAERLESDTERCGGCGFKWVEIAQAVKVVDAVGEALGVDTGTIGEARFRAAVDAALGEIVDPELPEPDPKFGG